MRAPWWPVAWNQTLNQTLNQDVTGLAACQTRLERNADFHLLPCLQTVSGAKCLLYVGSLLLLRIFGCFDNPLPSLTAPLLLRQPVPRRLREPAFFDNSSTSSSPWQSPTPRLLRQLLTFFDVSSATPSSTWQKGEGPSKKPRSRALSRRRRSRGVVEEGGLSKRARIKLSKKERSCRRRRRVSWWKSFSTFLRKFFGENPFNSASSTSSLDCGFGLPHFFHFFEIRQPFGSSPHSFVSSRLAHYFLGSLWLNGELAGRKCRKVLWRGLRGNSERLVGKSSEIQCQRNVCSRIHGRQPRFSQVKGPRLAETFVAF